MSDRRGGRHAFDAVAVTDVQGTPLLGIARREIRDGKVLVGIGVAVASVALVVDLLAVVAFRSPWHALVIMGLTLGGILIVQGTSKLRDGRATLRDQLRQQAESPPAGRAGDGE